MSFVKITNMPVDKSWI